MSEPHDSPPIEVDANDANKEGIVISSFSFYKQLRGFLSRVILNLAVTTALLSIAGFFVVHSYLSKLTHLFTYKVDAIVYISAGINMFLALVAEIFIKPFIPPINFIHIVIALIILAIVFYFRNKLRKYGQGKYAKYSQIRYLYRILGTILILFAILRAFVYGWDGYEHSARLLGGGQPADVILIFSQHEKLATMGLPIAINATYPAQSQPVKLLMELSDGVLVEDFLTQVPVIVKNELLYGMIDANPPTPSQQIATVSPAQTAATTPTPP